jgi:hypothetical protein
MSCSLLISHLLPSCPHHVDWALSLSMLLWSIIDAVSLRVRAIAASLGTHRWRHLRSLAKSVACAVFGCAWMSLYREAAMVVLNHDPTDEGEHHAHQRAPCSQLQGGEEAVRELACHLT